MGPRFESVRAHQANKRLVPIIDRLADESSKEAQFGPSSPAGTNLKPSEAGSNLRGGARERMRTDQREVRRERTLLRRWPHGQVVKTAASHAVNVGSNPAGVTISLDKRMKIAYNI